MSIEVRIDKNFRVARGRAVELTIQEEGRAVFTERLIFPAGLSRVEVRDRIGRLALARASARGQSEPDWGLNAGRRLMAREMLKPAPVEVQAEPQAPPLGAE